MADPRCTLSTTAVVFVVVIIGIGQCTYRSQSATGILCSVPIIPGSIGSSSRVQQFVRTSIVYGSIRTGHNLQLVTDCCVPYIAERLILLIEPAEGASVHVPLSQYAYLLLSYNITWHFTALMHMQSHLFKLLYCCKRSCNVL